MNNSNTKSIFDIDRIGGDNTVVGEEMLDISKLTFEDALTTVMTDQKEIGIILSEITRVENEIVGFKAGDLETIHVDEELTTEMSFADLASMGYNKMNKDKDKLLERAFEYIRTLINKAIMFIKSAITKYLAVHSKHMAITKELIGEISKIDLKDIPNTDELNIYTELGVILDNHNVLSVDATYFINGSSTVTDVIDKIYEYGNYISIIRPLDKVIMNTVSTEMGSARADILKTWNYKAAEKFMELFINKPIHKLLTDSVKYSIPTSDIDLDLRDVGKYTPISTDGSLITCIYKTSDHQLRLMRTTLKGLPRNTTLDMSKLTDILLSISKTDLNSIIKNDIKVLNKIEKDAKIYFNQVKDELGVDRGKRNASFNNTVTMINSALAIANNRMKLTNNIISTTENIINKYGA